MKRMLMAFATATLLIPAVPAAAAADPAPRGQAFGFHDRGHHRGHSTYDRQGRYIQPRQISRNDRVWQGDDGRYYCRRGNGTTGLIIGAAGGALIGRGIDTRGERATGTILGAAAGALLGREIDRGSARCR